MNVKTAVAAVSVAAVAGMAIVGLAGAQALGNAEEEHATLLKASEAHSAAWQAAQERTAAELAEATAPRFFAKVKASKDAEFVAAATEGLRYWEGRDGQTPATTIVRDKSNPCGEGAIGCAWTTVAAGKATCHIWIDESLKGNRWAMFAVATHEVGHCMGYGHIDGDMVMAP
jgi:hypothetical protein